MTEDQAIALTGALGALVLVGARLLLWRMPPKRMALLLAIWAAIFGTAFLIVRLFPNTVADFT